MTFEQLEYFIAITEHETFFDAAESLHISQSALSKQIQKLERELDLTLFDRSHRKASLTEGGQIFRQDARVLLKQYHQTLARIRQYQKDIQKEICVGTLPILHQYQLTSVFKVFAEQHLDIHVTLEEVEEQELLYGLEISRYDFIIARAHMVQSDSYQIYPITEDELVAIFPIEHPFASRTSISLMELAEEKFSLMNRYTSIYKLCMELFQEQNITPQIIRTARPESIISGVSIGESISLLAKSSLQAYRNERVAAVSLEPAVFLPVVAVRNKKKLPVPAVKELLHKLKQEDS